MAEYTWIGGGTSNWSTISNWSISPPGSTTPPTATDDVRFTNINPGLNNPCTITTLSTCRTLTIDSGYTSLITLNADLQVGANGLSPANTGITINGTPTFTGSGWLNLLTAGTTGVARSISSSAATEIYKLRIGTTANAGANFNFSGSVIANNLFINTAGTINRIGFAPSAQFILRNKTSETAIVTGSGGLNIYSVSPIPTLVVSGSVSWETNMVVGYNMIIASGSIFRLTGSLGPNYQTIGGGLTLNRGPESSGLLSTPLSFDVNANATILCTTASILSFVGGSSGGGIWNFNMSGSTTNIWNALNLGVTNGFTLNLSSDVYLAKNNYLPDLTNPSDNIYRIKGSLLLFSGNNTITTTGGSKTIYVGGSIINAFENTVFPNGVANSVISNTRFSAGGPKIVMYGTGYISTPPLNTLLSNTQRSSLGLGIDFDISSSNGTIRWGCGSLNRNIYNGGNNSTFPTWSYVTAANYDALPSTTFLFGSPGVLINFQNKPIWNLNLFNSLETRLSSSLVLSGSLSTFNNLNNLNTSSLTNPSLTVLQNIQSFYNTGSLNVPTALGQLRGNAPITMSGNLPATYSLLVPINNGRGNDILINKSVGNLLITNPLSGSGTIPGETKTPIPLTYDSGTFRWIAGTVNTSNSTLRLGNSASMDTAGANVSWYNITVSGSTATPSGSLVDIKSLLVITNELNLGAAGNVTFTGSDTWTCSRLVCTTPGRRITLQNAGSNGNKAYVTTTFINLSSSGAPISMSSNSPTTRASWSFTSTPSNVFNVDGIRIDSSNGNTIWTTGVTQSTINWNLGTQPIGSLYTFFID